MSLKMKCFFLEKIKSCYKYLPYHEKFPMAYVQNENCAREKKLPKLFIYFPTILR